MVLCCCVLAPAASAHEISEESGSLGVDGTSEKQLRAFETETLGPAHAAEHARERAAIRHGDAPPASGAKAEPTPPGKRAQLGRWTRRFKIPVIGINALMLPTGKVMWFAYPVNPNPTFGKKGAPNTAQAWLWNPANDKFKRIDPPLWRDPADGKLKPANIWCASQSFTADGRVLVAGGNLAYAKYNGGPFKGLNKIYTFDPFAETWARQPDMAHGRWYPSNALMPDGRTAIMGGLDERGGTYTPNLDVDLFKPAREFDQRGTVKTIGQRRQLSDTNPAHASRPPDGGLYPHLFWMPSGRLMIAGPDPSDTWFMNNPGRASRLTWSEYPPASRRRLWGTAVLLPQGPGGSTKVEQLGGSQPLEQVGKPPQRGQGTNTTETFDERQPSSWHPAAPMHIGRSHLNTVLLPDSSMVSVGGGIGTTPGRNQWAVTGKERKIEVFDPAANRWRLGPAQAESRAYHSTALLMPDGRVVSAGDDFNGGIDRDTAEIYEPPYLFKANGKHAKRPKITRAPHTVGYGRSFRVRTRRRSDVTRAALVAPGATTHANDMNQRVVPVALAKRRGGVSLTAPADRNIALPGYYMLFVLNSKGVPSVARWIRLGSSDGSGPRIAFNRHTGLKHRRTLTGRARDRSGVRRVEAAVSARKGKRCRWLVPRKHRFGPLRSCGRPRFFGARIRRKGATWRWRARLGRRLGPGSYRVSLRALDRPGNRTSRTGARAARVRVR